MRPERALDAVAAEHFGLTTREAARNVGLSRRRIDGLLTRDALVAVHRGVFVDAAVPRSWQQSLAAAVLAAGPDAAVSHRSAAIVWGFDGIRGDIVELTTPYRRSREHNGIRVHRSLDLAERWVTTVPGFRVTTPARTLLDLGAVVPRNAVFRAATNAQGRKLVTMRELQLIMRELGKRGRRGTASLRRFVESRSDVDPAGIAEAELAGVLHDADIPQVVPEYEIRDARGRFVARVDQALPCVQLAFEVNGYEWHGVYERFQSDHLRRNAITLAGWELIEFTPTQVRRDSDYVRRTAETAYRRLVL